VHPLSSADTDRAGKCTETSNTFVSIHCKYLGKPVDWKVTDNCFGKEFDSTQQCEHHPICQPLGVVILCCRFDGAHPANAHRYAQTFEYDPYGYLPFIPKSTKNTYDTYAG
jgi:hypothetical protein